MKYVSNLNMNRYLLGFVGKLKADLQKIRSNLKKKVELELKRESSWELKKKIEQNQFFDVAPIGVSMFFLVSKSSRFFSCRALLVFVVKLLYFYVCVFFLYTITPPFFSLFPSLHPLHFTPISPHHTTSNCRSTTKYYRSNMRIIRLCIFFLFYYSHNCHNLRQAGDRMLNDCLQQIVFHVCPFHRRRLVQRMLPWLL